MGEMGTIALQNAVEFLPDLTAPAFDVFDACDEALRSGVGWICIDSEQTSRCLRRLRSQNGNHVRVVARCGSVEEESACDRAQFAAQAAAAEIEVLVSANELSPAGFRAVRQRLANIVDKVRGIQEAIIIKSMLSAPLSISEIVAGCRLAAETQVDFIGISIGEFAEDHALDYVRLMRRCAAPLRVKVAGPILDVQMARRLLEAGADRIATAASAALLRNCSNR